MESNRAGLAAILKHPDCTAILSGHSRSLLAQFGLTAEVQRRGLAVGEGVDE
jgi:hypothetical protein